MTYEHQTQKQELENEEQARQLESLTDRWYLAVFQPFIPEQEGTAGTLRCSQESLTLFSKQTNRHSDINDHCRQAYASWQVDRRMQLFI